MDVQRRGELYSSPVVANGMIFVGSTNGNLFAVDPESGAEKWRFATEGHPDNDRQLLPESARTPRALRPVQ
jgi:outer membrane protein assembly factor BamB